MSAATLYIDGRWVAPKRVHQFCSFDPATEMRIDDLAAAGAEDVNQAVEAARNAFDRGWGQTSGHERAGFLEALADYLETRKGGLAVLEVRDNGKPLPEAECDIADAIGCFRYFAELARELDERQDQPQEVGDVRFSCRLRNEPVAVAGQIISWSSPFLMASCKVAAALAAGATCVLKPSELTPLTALELGLAANRVGLPPGVLNVLPGFEEEAGRALARHPNVDRLGFTGALPTEARIISAAAAGTRRLGGKSACIVFDDADIEATVEWVLFGILRNQGQTCSATSRLLVQEGIAPRLLERLVEAFRGIRIGSGLEEGVQLGPLISAGQYRRVTTAIEFGRRTAQLLTGGMRPGHLPIGHFIEPTLFDEPDIRSLLWRDEIFGPVLCVKRFKTEAQALAMANDSRYGLAAAVMSADLERAARIANGLHAGIVWTNCSQPTFTQASWGGRQQSGIGHELGRWGLENYLEVKQVTEYRSTEPWRWYPK